MLVTRSNSSHFTPYSSLTSDEEQENSSPVNTPPCSPVKARRTPLSPLKTPPSDNIAKVAAEILDKTPQKNVAVTQKASHPHIKRRILHSSEDAFFIQQSDNDKAAGKFCESDLIEHAFLRIQMFALQSVLLHGIGVRSDPNATRDISIDIGPAYLQMGQGSDHYQAAHCNANAGYTDNLRELFIEEITTENMLTPKKKHILQYKGFTKEELQLLEDNRKNVAKIRQEFDRIWPINRKAPQSVLVGTSVDFTLNSTTEVPQSVNLSCDKGLEAFIRPKAVDLYKRLMLGKITPQNACEEYKNNIVGYFEKIDALFKDRIAKIQKYQEEMEKGFQDFNKLDETETLDRLKTMQDSLLAINGIEEGKQKVLPRAKMRGNRIFLHRSIYELQKNDDYLAVIKKWVASKLDLFKLEVSDQLERFKDYQIYCRLEKEGSVVPNFTTLFGTYNEETAKKELKENDLNDLQSKLLKPTTPTAEKRKAISPLKSLRESRSSLQPRNLFT